MNALMPGTKFLGYEIVDVRFKEARRIIEHLELKHCQMVSQDIMDPDFSIPDADLYFIYDFSKAEDINALLHQLGEISKRKKFFIVAKGENVRTLIELKFPNFLVCTKPIHTKNWSIYVNGWTK